MVAVFAVTAVAPFRHRYPLVALVGESVEGQPLVFVEHHPGGLARKADHQDRILGSLDPWVHQGHLADLDPWGPPQGPVLKDADLLVRFRAVAAAFSCRVPPPSAHLCPA